MKNYEIDKKELVVTSRAERLAQLREERDERETSLGAIKRAIQALEDEAVAEALEADKNASEADLELPTVGWTAVDTLGRRWFSSKLSDLKHYMDTHGMWAILEEVVLKKDAEKIIKDLSDLAISLGETQGGKDPDTPEEAVEVINRLLGLLPPMVANQRIPVQVVGENPTEVVANRCIGLLNEQGFVGLPMRYYTLLLPDSLHPDTVELVINFAIALGIKLNKSQNKYGFQNGWKDDNWLDECKLHLHQHLEKGDPRDVAAYCAFLWYHEQSTKLAD